MIEMMDSSASTRPPKRKSLSTGENEGNAPETSSEPLSAKRPIKRRRSSMRVDDMVESILSSTTTPKRSRRLSQASSDAESSDNASGSSSENESVKSNLSTPRKSTRVSSLAISSAKAIRKTIQQDERQARAASSATGANIAAPTSARRKAEEPKTQRKLSPKLTNSENEEIPATSNSVSSPPIGSSSTTNTINHTATEAVPFDLIRSPSSPKHTRSRLSYGGLLQHKEKESVSEVSNVITEVVPVIPPAPPAIVVVPELPRVQTPAEPQIPTTAVPPQTQDQPTGNQNLPSTTHGRDAVTFSVMSRKLPRAPFLLFIALIGLGLMRQFFPSNHQNNLSSSPATYLFAPLHHLNEWKGLHIGKNQEASMDNLPLEQLTRIVAKQSLSDDHFSSINGFVSNITTTDLMALQNELQGLQEQSNALREFVANFNETPIDTKSGSTQSIKKENSQTLHESHTSQINGVVEIPVNLDIEWLQEYHRDMAQWENEMRDSLQQLSNVSKKEVEMIYSKVATPVIVDTEKLMNDQSFDDIENMELLVGAMDDNYRLQQLRDAAVENISSFETKFSDLDKLNTTVSSLMSALAKETVMNEKSTELDAIHALKTALHEFLPGHPVALHHIPSTPFNLSELDELFQQVDNVVDNNVVENTADIDNRRSFIESDDVPPLSNSILTDSERDQQKALTQEIVFSYLEENSESVEQEVKEAYTYNPTGLEEEGGDVDSLPWGVDFGVGPRGGRVISPRRLSKIDGSELTSNCFEPATAEESSQTMIHKITSSVFKTFNAGVCVTSSKIINSYLPVRPGRCYAINGDHGSISVSAYAPVNLRAISISHYVPYVSDDVLPMFQSSKSAIREFTVIGYTIDPTKYNEAHVVNLGNFSYDIDSKLEDSMHIRQDSDNGAVITQIFSVEAKFPIQTIQLKFTSNHGERDFSCIYRLKMLGDLATI